MKYGNAILISNVIKQQVLAIIKKRAVQRICFLSISVPLSHSICLSVSAFLTLLHSQPCVCTCLVNAEAE